MAEPVTHEEFERAVALYENVTPEGERRAPSSEASEKLHSNDHGDVVILNDASGREIGKASLDSNTFTVA